MECNVGMLDRVIRFLLANALFALTLFTHGPYDYVFMFLGAIPILTAVLGFCPAYKLLGINTCRNAES